MTIAPLFDSDFLLNTMPPKKKILRACHPPVARPQSSATGPTLCRSANYVSAMIMLMLSLVEEEARILLTALRTRVKHAITSSHRRFAMLSLIDELVRVHAYSPPTCPSQACPYGTLASGIKGFREPGEAPLPSFARTYASMQVLKRLYNVYSTSFFSLANAWPHASTYVPFPHHHHAHLCTCLSAGL